MTISNEPIVAGTPVKFKITGFPEETAVRAAIERFYALKTDADRQFLIDNTFNELIFSGAVDDDGKVEKLVSIDRKLSTNAFIKK